MSRTLRRVGVPLAAVLLLAGCGYDATVVKKPQAEPASTAPAAPPVTCDNPTQSYAPSRAGGSSVAKIKRRGRLVAGVSGDTFRLGARNPKTGAIEGFDITIAQRVADELGVRLTPRVISAADRIPLLQKGEVDIVARNMTMNCARWQQIGFSAEYYHASQKVLLRADLAAKYKGPQSLAGKKVCAPAGSTSVDNIRKTEPDAIAVEAANHTGCLVRLQRGEVDAITGDDTVLAGLAAQDPYAVVPVQAPFSDEPYGVGVNKDDVDLARFVNDVLEQMHRDGTWQRAYNEWLKPYLHVDAVQPTPRYGR
ncbi:MAG TPA: glutamate ABC transporter substrate-binding protein [Nocardioides sp.]|nr:glutamate ABC transporter substrate-binding protein [Nocardioides sp.]